YSLIVEGAGTSEAAAIEQTTAHLGVSTRRVAPGALGLDDLVQYALRAEMPQWWTSDLALGTLARAARADGAAVVLAGEGPDELFAGYDVHRLAPFRPLFTGLARPLAGATRLAIAVGQRFIPWLPIDASVVDAYLTSHDRGREREIVDHFGFHPEHLATWEALEGRSPLAPALREQQGRHRERERVHFRSSLAATAEGLSSTERNLQYEISERLPQWILHMGDRMSSTHGIELRFPYLDDDFVAAALRLPMECRATVGESKRALRRAHRRRLPAAAAARRKQALYTPAGEWLGPVLGDERLPRYWSRRVFERAGLLDFDACEAARARLSAGQRPDALTGMVDEWLFVFALTTSILAVEACGA
ncbi:MAG: asparagine synthase, partial [Myxococcales bacterium]